MEFLDLVRSRYSCKKFDKKEITKAQLDTILEAGRLAPTAKNNQEQHIYVVQTKEAKDKINLLTPCHYGAPTVLMLSYDRTNTFIYPGERHNSGVEDVSIVATHMLLAAKSVGVESCWINNFDPEKAKELFKLPENEELLCFIYLGFPAVDTKPLANHDKRKAIEEIVTYI